MLLLAILLFCCALVVGVASVPYYEPQCDTNRRERDGLRDRVYQRVRSSGEFKGVAPGRVGAQPGLDPQGGSTGYFFLWPMGIATFRKFRYSTDAILHIMCNPAPPGPTYWGKTEYLVSYTTSQVQGGPAAEMGDSLNQFVLNSTAMAGIFSGQEHLPPWGKTSAVITTPDIDSAAVLRDALVAEGFPLEAINVHVVPAQLVDRQSFGLGAVGSLYATGFRERGWADTEEASRYNVYLEPVQLFFDRDRIPNPYPTPALRPRGGKENELALLPSFFAFLNQTKRDMSDQGYTLTNEYTFQRVPAMDLEFCYETFDVDLGCQLANQDISYGFRQERIPIQENGFNLIVGVIHSLTGLAEYSSVGLVNGNVDTLTLQNTTTGLAAQAAGSNSHLFYSLDVRLDCSQSQDRPCIEPPPPYTTERLATLNDIYAERAALQKSTKTGPAFEDLIPAVILTYRPSTN